MNVDLTTFVFETVNFVVLVWLLHRVVYKPLREGIAKRKGEVIERELVASRQMEEAKQLQEASQDDRKELARLREDVVRAANEEAAEQRARILSQARDDAEAERARVRRLLESERDAALSWVSQLAVERGTEVAGLLLMELAPSAIEDALYEQLTAELERRDLSDVEVGEHPEVEVTVATMPGKTRIDELRASLEKALGGAPRLVLREDASLRAGLVIRAGHRVLDASVAGQLDAFRDRVRHELDEEMSVA
jgi:F-type H+-transporting ATPase subunit b